jgi:phage recombination protein Bet
MSTELDIIHDGSGRIVATRGAARSEIALSPDQTSWTPKQVAALRQLGIEDAPEGDLEVFFHVCRTSGLDPFRKQIYMIGRRTKVSTYDEQQRQWNERWTTKYTIQTGIDGFRRNGRVAAKREGETIRVDGPYWQGPDGGGWQDVWLSNQPPAAAKFVIFRDGEAHTGIAMYREFVQHKPNTSQPNSMWAKMPANQLAKCAEAQAWRRAYPDDFSGMQLEDAAQVIDSDGAPVPATARRAAAGEGRSAGGGTITSGLIRAWPTEQPPGDHSEAEAASNSSAKPTNPQADEDSTPVVSAEGAENPESNIEPNEPKATRAQQQHISTRLETIGATERAHKRAYLTKFFGRKIATVAALTQTEADEVIDELDRQIAERNAGQEPDSVAEATDMEGTEQFALDTVGGTAK